VVALVAVAAALGLPLEARAQQCPAGGTPEQVRALAGEAFAEGQRLFDAGEFQAALVRFECSFSLVPHANTLFNMGECAVELGDLQRALGYFRDLLQRFPEDQNRVEVEARVRQLESQLEATSPPAPPPDEPGLHQDEDTRAAGGPALLGRRMTLARRFAWGTFAAGLAVAVMGIGLYAAAVSINREFAEAQDEASESMAEIRRMRDRGQGLEAGGWTFMSLGATSLVASILLFFLFDATEAVGESTP
jgi:tetratricopeptide (TPR) repeat protein